MKLSKLKKMFSVLLLFVFLLGIDSVFISDVKCDDADTWYNMGLEYCHQSNYDEAIKCCEKTIAIDVPVLRGNSGGPVISINRGRDVPVVIGVTRRVAKDTETFVICIKSRYILDLLPPTPK